MSSNLLIDVILVLTILLGIVIGTKRGFVKSVAKPIKFVLAIILAFTFASSVGAAVVEPIVDASLENKIESVILEKCQDVTVENASDSLPTVVKFAAGLSGIDIEALVGDNTAENAAKVISESLTAPIISIVSSILAFILLYFGVRLALSLLLSFVAKMADDGVVGFANRLLGFCFSIVMMFVVCWCLTAVFDFVVHLPALEEVSWANEFTGGYVYSFFRNVSPIDLLLSF